MKDVKIWTEQSKNDKEDYFYLRLINTNDDQQSIYLHFVDKEGVPVKASLVMVYQKNMRCFITQQDLNPDLPLKTDHECEAIVINEEQYNSMLQRHKMILLAKEMAEQVRSDIVDKKPTLN